MRSLVDANLPPALAEWLCEQGYEAVHVHSIGLVASLDIAIWRYASKTNAIVVTKDEDRLIESVRPRRPSRSLAACRKCFAPGLLERLADVWPEVMAELEAWAKYRDTLKLGKKFGKHKK